MTSILVTVGTDGATNWVRLPSGQKFNLGMMSVLNFVSKLTKSGAMARKTLQDFLKTGETMLTVNPDVMWDILQPGRPVWAADSFMSPDQQQSAVQETTRMSNVWDDLAKEAQAFKRLASDDEQDEIIDEEVEEEGTPKEAATQKLSFDVYASNLELAKEILASARTTLKAIDSKVASGRKFNAARARADVFAITSKTGSICEKTEMVETWVASDLQKLSSEMQRIHDLFHPQS